MLLPQAVKIALETKKHLVDNNLHDVTQVVRLDLPTHLLPAATPACSVMLLSQLVLQCMPQHCLQA